eukprot:3117106-Pleurochrysis_carterae.AAC.1
MTVGHTHTHKDIDALFKRVTTYWQKLGKVLTPAYFMQYLASSLPDVHVFDIVEYTHDWADYFKGCIYGGLVGITGAREYIIKMRADG